MTEGRRAGEPGLTRRQMLQYSGAAASAIFLSSCGSGGDQPAASSGNGNASPTRGGALTLGALDALPDLRIFPNLGAPAYRVLAPAVFDTLLTLDGNYQAQPGLAESFEQSADKTTLSLKLRKGVQFHTGREMTSEDVLWTLKRALDPVNGLLRQAPTIKAFTDMQTPDKYTVILKAEKPNPTAIRMLNALTILDKTTLEGPNAQRTAVGTGPFKMTRFVQGQAMEFTRNEKYWQANRPYLDSVTVRIFRDLQAVNAALRTGEILGTAALGGGDIPSFKEAGFAVTENLGWPGFKYLLADVQKPALRDKRVRQALNHAYDRQTAAKISRDGVPTTVPWLPKTPVYKPEWEQRYPYDLDKARALLKEAGVSNFDTSVLILTQDPTNEQHAEVLRDSAQQIGANINIDALAFNEWLQKYNGNHALILNGILTDPDPAVAFSQAVLLRPNNDQMHWTTPEYTDLAGKIIVETDEQKVTEMAQRATEILLDECAIMPSLQGTPRLVNDRTVKDLAWTRIFAAFDVGNAWLSK